MIKMATTPIYGKNPLKSSSQNQKADDWELVWSIEDGWPTKFVQIMILGWPWPTIKVKLASWCIKMGKTWKVEFSKTVEAKVIILTIYV